MKNITKLRIGAALACGFTLAVIVFGYLLFGKDLIFSLAIFSILSLTILIVFALIQDINAKDNQAIEKNLNSSITRALREGEIGILIYNEEYEITFMSGLFMERSIDRTGEKLLLWLPELQGLLSGEVDRVTIVINDDKYLVRKRDNAYVLVFKDISKEYDLEKKIENDAYVLGFVNYDNYDESNESEDTVSYVNINIKLPVIEYFKKYGIVYRTLRNSRLQLTLNERQFSMLQEDRFSILNTVRREAKKSDLDITLSMSFARHSDDLTELDSAAQNLLELAQTRGGDQVVVREIGKEAVFYGGSSESREKQSKVKVRVMANTLKHLIQSSANVIIIGHQMADADCVGAAIAMSNIVRSLGKEALIILKSGGVESMISDVLSHYKQELDEKHVFVSETEALNKLRDETLVILVDHHSLDQTNGSSVIKQAKHIVVIDHHRRRADLEFSAQLLYVESGASSSTELLCEFLPYMPKRLQIEECEANIMYLGIMIDTNNFRVRTGARTFDVCKSLRQYGAEPADCAELAQEPYANVRKRTQIMAKAELYKPGVIVAAMPENETYPRSIASQAADQLIQTKEIEASFVICRVAEDTVAVTARSKGSFNVQVILEKMQGGGHMRAAGLQRKDTDVAALKGQVLASIDEYLNKEVSKDESDNVK